MIARIVPYPLRNTALFSAHRRESRPLSCPLPAVLNTPEPLQNMLPPFLLPLEIPSAATKNTWIPPLRFPCTTVLPSDHCFGRHPLVCSTPPAADCDLPLEVLVPCCTPPYTMMESDVLHVTFSHYSRLHHIFASASVLFQAADIFDAYLPFLYGRIRAAKQLYVNSYLYFPGSCDNIIG